MLKLAGPEALRAAFLEVATVLTWHKCMGDGTCLDIWIGDPRSPRGLRVLLWLCVLIPLGQALGGTPVTSRGPAL